LAVAVLSVWGHALFAGADFSWLLLTKKRRSCVGRRGDRERPVGGVCGSEGGDGEDGAQRGCFALPAMRCVVLVDNWLCCLKEHLEDEHGLDYEEEARCQGEDVDVFVLSLFDGES